jgi:hypothetical protein
MTRFTPKSRNNTAHHMHQVNEAAPATVPIFFSSQGRAWAMVQGVAIPAMDISKLGVANADGVLQHGLEHRLKIVAL